MIGYLATNHPLVQAFVPVAARRPGRPAAAGLRGGRAAPKLADFLPEEECTAVRGPLERPISGLATDWRRVTPGAVFFDLPGADGRSGGDAAASRGAVAVVRSALPACAPRGLTVIQVADVRVALARAAQRFFRFPDRSLGVVGVTGAHGKTTVAHLLKHLLNGDQRVGLLGSVHYELGQRTVPSLGDLPEALEVQGLLAQMRDAGCRNAVLEVSARALAGRRVDGLQWAAAVYTGGGTLPVNAATAYPEFLFDGGAGPAPAVAVVNLGDAAGASLARRLTARPAGPRVITYGDDPAADVRAEQVTRRRDGTTLRVIWPGGAQTVESPLVGLGQVTHLLAAVAAAWGVGRDPQVVLARLRAFGGVPGRCERIPSGQDFTVWVDAAGTPETLRHTLRELRAVTPGRLRVVFGADGQGERALRPALTRTAEELADVAIATVGHPRAEPVARILADLRAGAAAPERIAWVADRREAIALAVAQAAPGDGIVIAGRGHQVYQELGDTVVPLDDRQVVRAALGRRGT